MPESEVRMRRGAGSSADDAAADQDTPDKDTEIARLTAELTRLKADKDAASAGKALGSKEAGEAEQEDKERMATDIAKALEKSVPKPVKGLSHAARECKTRLEADPFNMQQILDLGLAYGQDSQWDRCEVVLMRGWKRVSEFEDTGARYALLACLTEASLKTSKFRQALAVMSDIQEPDAKEQQQHFQELRCRVYCENGDLQKALQAWKKTIDGRGFDEVLSTWARCLTALKRANALEVTRGSLAELAGDEKRMQQIEAVEKLVSLRDEMFVSKTQDKPNPAAKKAAFAMLGVLVLFLVFMLHKLESASFSKMSVS